MHMLTHLFLKKILLVLLGVYTSLVFADPPAVDKEQLLRFAEADGARIALGRICKLPEDDLITLGNKQEALTLAIAKRNSIELDSKTYVEAAKLGLRSTVELVTLISPNKKSYKKNCREVRATFMKNLVAFDLYLSDSPGTNGHPYAFTPWMIVTGKQQPMGMAMVDGKQVLVSDMTDPEGHIVLDEKQQKAVMEAFCRHPDQTWLMYPGQSIQLGTANEDPTWTQYADMRKHRAQRLKNCFTR